MPEFTEVERYRSEAEKAVGATVTGIDLRDDRLLRRGPDPAVLYGVLGGARLDAAERIGKVLFLVLASGREVAMTFGLRGSLRHGRSVEDLARRPDHVRIVLEFDDGNVLLVEDQLRMATVELDFDRARLGVDVRSMARDDLAGVLGASEVAVKTKLMDQAKIAGIGNLLADGMLWDAGIDPRRASNDLDDGELDRLFDSIARIRDEVVADGGSHTVELIATNSREPGEPCDKDGAPMERTTVGGRTTYFCPEHQG